MPTGHSTRSLNRTDRFDDIAAMDSIGSTNPLGSALAGLPPPAIGPDCVGYSPTMRGEMSCGWLDQKIQVCEYPCVRSLDGGLLRTGCKPNLADRPVSKVLQEHFSSELDVETRFDPHANQISPQKSPPKVSTHRLVGDLFSGRFIALDKKVQPLLGRNRS
jgi:hypothetical protein